MIDAKVIAKYDVRWNPEQAVELLTNAAIRDGGKDIYGNRPVEVEIEWQWMSLCRTDLKDDVSTFVQDDANDLEGARAKYLSRVRLGARKTVHNDGRITFAVIDSYSDG